jgi:signal transduction histidine kinase
VGAPIRRSESIGNGFPSFDSEAELRRLNWALAAYARSSVALRSNQRLEDLAAGVCGAIVENEAYILACVGIAEDSPGKPVRLVAGKGAAVGYMDGLELSWSDRVPQGMGATGNAIRSGNPYIMLDSRVDPIFSHWRAKSESFGIRSSVTVPIKHGDTVIGALIVYAPLPDAFGPPELTVFEQLAGELAFAISLSNDRLLFEASEAARRAAEDRLRDVQAELVRIARISTLGEIASSIAHEINQPLAAVMLNAEASLRWLAKAPPNLERAVAAIQRAVDDANRATDVVKRVRSLATKEAPNYVDLDVNGAIVEILALTQGELQRANVSARCELAAALPSACGDRIQFQQVMLNLIMNGVEAMAAVSDRARALRICSSATEAGGVLIEVEDCGPGLEAGAIDRLFDHFFTTKNGGTGLGLAISRSIVEAHGGQIWAAQSAQMGAVFRFTLPPSQGCRH